MTNGPGESPRLGGADGRAIRAEPRRAAEGSQATQLREGTPDGESWGVERNLASSRKS